MRSESYCTWFVCVGLSDAHFLRFGKLTEGTNGFGATCGVDYYKKEFHYSHFIHKVWRPLLTMTV